MAGNPLGIPNESSSYEDIGYGGAAKIFGAESLAQIVDEAQPSQLYQYGRITLNDHHALVQQGIAIGGIVCIVAEPCGATGAAGLGLAGAADFFAERFKLW